MGNELTGREGNSTRTAGLLPALATAIDTQYYGANSSGGGSVAVFWTSMGNWTTFDGHFQGAKKDGNYQALSDAAMWERNPGM